MVWKERERERSQQKNTLLNALQHNVGKEETDRLTVRMNTQQAPWPHGAWRDHRHRPISVAVFFVLFPAKLFATMSPIRKRTFGTAASWWPSRASHPRQLLLILLSLSLSDGPTSSHSCFFVADLSACRITVRDAHLIATLKRFCS